MPGLLIVLVMTTLATGVLRADSVRLNDQAAADGPDVHLADVAELHGPIAKALAKLVVGKLPDKGSLTVQLATVRQLLDKKGVNWGMLTLAGYDSCRVQHAVPAPPPLVNSNTQPVITNPADAVSIDTPVTLRQRIIAWLATFTGHKADNLRVSFADADAKQLDASTWQERLDIQPLANGPLGRLPLAIRRYRGDMLVGTNQLLVDVALRTLAVVAVHDISRGATITPDDVQVREVLLTTANTPMTKINAVIGQTAAGTLRAGTIITADKLSSPVLVRRGELVTVRCLSGGLVIRTVGRAAGNGTLGDEIEIRNERSRRSFEAKVVGPDECLLALGGSGQATGSATRKSSAKGGAQ